MFRRTSSLYLFQEEWEVDLYSLSLLNTAYVQYDNSSAAKYCISFSFFQSVAAALLHCRRWVSEVPQQMTVLVVGQVSRGLEKKRFI